MTTLSGTKRVGDVRQDTQLVLGTHWALIVGGVGSGFGLPSVSSEMTVTLQE